MRGIATAQISAGAKTCVLVGPLDAVPALDLSDYESILWFSGNQTWMPPSVAVDYRRIAVEKPERFTIERASSALDRLIQRDALRLPSIFVTEKAMVDTSGRFLPVVETIVAQCERHGRARLTRQQVGFAWQSHLLANLPAYARRRVPAAWAGALAGVPAFVCGSGPSLETSGEKLAAFADRAVVFAADSALVALDRRGIAADFAVTVDATKLPEKCLPAGRMPSRLLAASISPPAWRHAFADDAAGFISGNQITENWLANLGLARTTIGVAGNCGITALELAIHLGCGPIYLFGMDHALDANGSGRLHQRETAERPAGEETLQGGGEYPKVPGNYQENVATPFLREWRMLDARCAELSPGLVFNVTDRGARLSNTTLVAPAAFALSTDALDKSARLASLAPWASIDDATWRGIVAAVRGATDTVEPLVAQARAALQDGDEADAIRVLKDAFREKTFGQLMGSYGLKAIPHLLQPSAGNRALWTTLVDECVQLLALAKGLA
ncbi:MAG TPA: 6-hydroxymethylpterin diphosphokinase MptE-like protein [Opitutaceae bacterium]|nr:6-hydroxymethylpterin diphosphokinase MptE-like protein [Opitutaceae bacterium]